MSALPLHYYTPSAADSRQMALNWFKKKYPDLTKIGSNEFEIVAFDIFDVCKNLIGTESMGVSGPGFGGSHGEIRCAIAVSMGISIDFESRDVRHFNKHTIAALIAAWRNDDHASFLSRCAGFERNATNSKIDLLLVATEAFESFWEINDEEDEHIDIPESIEEWVEVLCEPSFAQYVIGNRSRNRLRCKSAERTVNSLFDGI